MTEATPLSELISLPMAEAEQAAQPEALEGPVVPETRVRVFQRTVRITMSIPAAKGTPPAPPQTEMPFGAAAVVAHAIQTCRIPTAIPTMAGAEETQAVQATMPILAQYPAVGAAAQLPAIYPELALMANVASPFGNS